MKRTLDKPLPALSPARHDDRGVRADSVTNQLRALAKQKPRKRPPPVLEPLAHEHHFNNDTGSSLQAVSVQRQIQGPVSLQWLVDDFVQSAGTGDIAKVDHYIRGGIPIDMKHSVLQQTALHASTALKSDTVTRHLVQAGADVNALTKDRESALHLAARYHSVAVAEEVLRNSADMRVLNRSDMLAMQVAADVEDHAMEQLLEPPPDPPSNVRATAITSTSITVEWSSHGLATSAYQFRVSWVPNGSLNEFFEICSRSSFRISNLMPASQYDIHVQTGNLTVGWSPSSDVLVVETDGDVPNAMAAPSVLRVSDHSITMRIRLPPSNGADVQRISIQLQCTGSVAAVVTSSFRKLLRSADQEQRWESVLCDAATMRHYEDDPHDKQHRVEGLLPGHVYYFRVKACNRFGWSPDGEVSDGICTNDTPKVVAATARSMTLVWTKPYSTELIDKYQVQARLSYSTKWEIVANDVFQQSAQVCDLIPATAYSFRVLQHYASSQRWEDAESCAFTELSSTHTTVPEAPLSLRVMDRTATSITLSWEMPRCNGHAVTEYRLEQQMKCEDNCSQEAWEIVDAQVPIDAKTYTVDSLSPGRSYQFRIGAINALGNGPYVELIGPPVWTFAFLPPTAPECLARTSFSLTIMWRDGTSGGGTRPELASTAPRALQYEVQVCHIDSSFLHAPDLSEIISTTGEWRTVVDGLDECQALISGLNPLGCYCFRVRAHSSSGVTPSDNSGSVFSPVSSLFQTLRRM